MPRYPAKANRGPEPNDAPAQLAVLADYLEDRWLTVATAGSFEPPNDSGLLIDEPFRGCKGLFRLSNEFSMGSMRHVIKTI